MRNSKTVEVSIACITYNQAAYIERAIQSFLMQRTNGFEFEIIIHDDCSTDGTAEILKEYEKRFPEKIRCIYEERNRYREYVPGGYIYGLILSVAKGRYIAVCEGDDYWTDKSKLQKQFDYMELHPNCSEYAHAAIVTDAKSNKEIGRAGGNSERDMYARDIVSNFDIPTASRFSRRTVMEHYAEEWNFPKAVGDFPSAIYSASKGYIHYDPTPMSIYQYRSPNSYTQNLNTANFKTAYSNAKDWISMLNNIDQATSGKLHDSLIDFSYTYVSTLFQLDGGVALEIPFAREAFYSFGTTKRMKCYAKRLLWKCGFAIKTIGWKETAKRKLIKVENA